MVRGHAFVKMNDLLIDPQRKVIYLDPDWIMKRYVVYAEGNEPYDLGLTDFKTSMKKFMEFKEKHQKEKVV